MRRVRELARRMEFLEAGEDPGDKMDAALLQAEIDRLYVAWGVKAVSGLAVDGVEAGPELLADAGPEELFREALAAVRSGDRAERRRKKKLLVAFHFQFANQAGWECDACRRVRPGNAAALRVAGIAAGRQRGAGVGAEDGGARDCPKSYITAESEGLVEEFLVRRAARRDGLRAS